MNKSNNFIKFKTRLLLILFSELLIAKLILLCWIIESKKDVFRMILIGDGATFRFSYVKVSEDLCRFIEWWNWLELKETKR